MRGVVCALDYVEEGWDQPAPYQVELEDGTLIFAPIDEDWVKSANGSSRRKDRRPCAAT